MEHCRLFLNGIQNGEVRWETTGRRVTVWASCPFEERYIYRIQLRGFSGKTLNLGVMLPQDGRFFVRRSFSATEAQLLLSEPSQSIRGEVLRALPGETRALPLPFAFSDLRPLLGVPFPCDPLLQQCVSGKANILYTIFLERTYLVVALDENCEFPLSPFFCLVTPIYIQERIYGAISVDRNGEVAKIPQVN